MRNISTGNIKCSCPYSRINTLLKEKVPTGTLYTSDANIAVHFYQRVVLGPWDERTYDNSAYIKRNFRDVVLPKMQQVVFAGAIESGSNCQSKAPKGEFTPNLNPENLEVIKIKKLCLFTSKE